MKKFLRKNLGKTDKIDYISKSVLPIDEIVSNPTNIQDKEVQPSIEVAPVVAPIVQETPNPLPAEVDLTPVENPASGINTLPDTADGSDSKMTQEEEIPGGVGDTDDPGETQPNAVQEDNLDRQNNLGLTKGLSKLTKEQLMEMGLTPRSNCTVPLILRCDEQTYDRLAEIKQRDRVFVTVIVYEAILYYINTFYAGYRDPAKTNNEEGALNKKSTSVKHKMGWAEPDLRTVRIPLSIDDKTDYLLAKIGRKTKQFKTRLGYDAIIYYLNQFYRNVTGF